MRVLKASRIALLGGLVLAGAAAAEADRPISALERAGWTLVTMSEDVDVYMRAEGAAGAGHRRAWTAYDAAEPRERDGFSFRSVESLSEFDCKRRVSRVVQEIYHDGPALQGKAWESPDFMATPWAAPAPGSVGAIRMAYACKALADT